MERKKKTGSLYMAYVPMTKGQGRSLTHYTGKGGTRGYVTLRTRQPEDGQKPPNAAAEGGRSTPPH